MLPENKISERFWSLVTYDHGCLRFGNGSDPNPQFRINGESISAARFAWEEEHGLVAPDLKLEHLCRNQHCVMTLHLKPVKVQELVRNGCRSAMLPIHTRIGKLTVIAHQASPRTSGGVKHLLECSVCGKRRWMLRFQIRASGDTCSCDHLHAKWCRSKYEGYITDLMRNRWESQHDLFGDETAEFISIVDDCRSRAEDLEIVPAVRTAPLDIMDLIVRFGDVSDLETLARQIERENNHG